MALSPILHLPNHDYCCCLLAPSAFAFTSLLLLNSCLRCRCLLIPVAIALSFLFYCPLTYTAIALSPLLPYAALLSSLLLLPSYLTAIDQL